MNLNDKTKAVSAGGQFTFLNSRLTVQRMGYGAMQLAGPGVWGPPKDIDEAVKVLRTAVEAGVNHIDTSDFYGPHVTNEIIKKALYPYAKDLVIVTKIGCVRPSAKVCQRADSPEELTQAVHDNLRNLNLDVLDIVNYRVMGTEFGPTDNSVAKQMEMLAELKQKGLIRNIGISNATAEQIEEAQKITDIVCVQNSYNLANREDDMLIDKLAEQGIAYVPYFPLGGFNPLQSSILTEISEELGCKPMQTALAWLLHRSPNILLIPGTSSSAHLLENISSADIKLSGEALDALDKIAGK